MKHLNPAALVDKHTFRQLDQLDTSLGRLLLELQFIISLVEGIPPQPLQIDSNAWLVVMTQFAGQLGEAQRSLRRLAEKFDK